MNSYVQLILIIFSLFYGFWLFRFNQFNIKVFKNKNLLIKLVGNILYINTVTLLYLFVLYKLNSGELHIYFVLLLIIGYIGGSVKYCK